MKKTNKYGTINAESSNLTSRIIFERKNSNFTKKRAKIFGTFGDLKKGLFGNTILIEYI